MNPPVGKGKSLAAISAKAEARTRSWWQRRSLSQQIVLSYVLVAFYGALVFLQPFCWREQRPGVVDCLFLSTSAVCVTGLATFDYAAQLTLFGKGVLLTLIEIGGLGTMTLATFFLTLAQRRSSLRLLMSVGDTFYQGVGGHIRWLGVKVFAFAVFVQALGALLLYYHWEGMKLPDPHTTFNAIFHSASAFCNAGFALFSDSLVSFRRDLWTNVIVAGLVVAGGLGYFVHFELGTHSIKTFGRKKIYLTLQSKVMLIGTAFLLLLGGWAFFFLEQGRTLAAIPPEQQIGVSLFQSTMTRTAGFNSIDWGAAREATCLLAIFLMFVGAGPGSTAGGIKITTVATLWAVIASRFRGRSDVVLMGRVLPHQTVLRAMYVTLLSLLAVAAVIGGILLAESLFHPNRRQDLLSISFESVSAFATVGLSMGITASLSWASKLLLCFAMIAGRVGPLGLSLAVYEGKEGAGFGFPEEDLMIG